MSYREVGLRDLFIRPQGIDLPRREVVRVRLGRFLSWPQGMLRSLRDWPAVAGASVTEVERAMGLPV